MATLAPMMSNDLFGRRGDYYELLAGKKYRAQTRASLDAAARAAAFPHEIVERN